MSAHNRQVLMKKSNGGSLDDAMDESGYASFQVAHHSQHNSTVEAPFLFEHNSETENCRNASNTIHNHHYQHHQFYKDFASTQFQTPCSPEYSIAVASQWRKVSSVPINKTVDSGADETCKSPLPNQIHSATKRRKQHFQIASHSSPKKSKKQLFSQAPQTPKQRRTRYYNDIDRLDIVTMLANTMPALDCILSKVSAATLDVMTKVSKSWEQTVYKSRRAVERLHNHRLKMNLTKENPHVVMRGRTRHKFNNNQTVPLQPFNAINQTSAHASLLETAGAQLMDVDSGRNLVEQAQRVKCPRCSRSSKVYRSEQAKECGNAALSSTLPTIMYQSHSISQRSAPFTRFYSLEEVQRSPDESTNAEAPYTFAECTGVSCRFRFCLHCHCRPHPGEKCLVTELGTPSKLTLPSENVTPPKQRNKKNNSKLSRKNSLKRLCF